MSVFKHSISRPKFSYCSSFSSSSWRSSFNRSSLIVCLSLLEMREPPGVVSYDGSLVDLSDFVLIAHWSTLRRLRLGIHRFKCLQQNVHRVGYVVRGHNDAGANGLVYMATAHRAIMTHENAVHPVDFWGAAFVVEP